MAGELELVMILGALGIGLFNTYQIRKKVPIPTNEIYEDFVLLKDKVLGAGQLPQIPPAPQPVDEQNVVPAEVPAPQKPEPTQASKAATLQVMNKDIEEIQAKLNHLQLAIKIMNTQD